MLFFISYFSLINTLEGVFMIVELTEKTFAFIIIPKRVPKRNDSIVISNCLRFNNHNNINGNIIYTKRDDTT